MEERKRIAVFHDIIFSSEIGELRQLRLAPNGLADTIWAFATEVSVMAPFIDFANHAFDFNSFVNFGEPGKLTLKSVDPISPGEELTVSYGQKPNVQLMNEYGFVLSGNPYDRVAVPPAPGSGLESLPPLHGASLLEALGFEGDWRREDGIDATRATVESVAGDAAAEQAAWQRRSVCWSLNLTEGQPLAAPEAAKPKALGVGGAARRKRGALFSRPKASQPQPQPQPPPGAALPAPAHHVPLAAIPAERANAAAVRAAFRAALDALPTSLEADAELLAAHERSGREGGEGRLSARVAAAVRSRMEHKALLAEGVRAMNVYDSWLAGRQGAG
ncbi:hypothetical protein GPECTOR_8g357 [Gonium pectorale]|uniref:SET domain-containing protein n=1 Tax=Gonium pectorale TaxID=33097 RepID=A0A150GT10_GONPE|nr:hypothetical protein GPECTOR_8g357 [Gonium pectorale]|eukprot:KXZ52986.1 hypothetical protein GPECTOR_8g357 [Gonium pectorale]